MSIPEPLTLPSDLQILLNSLRGTDGKVDRLLPLLELLNDPEPERSNIGEALLEALKLIVEEVQLIRMQREEQAAQIGKLEAVISRFEASTQESNQKINAMHALLLSPLR